VDAFLQAITPAAIEATRLSIEQLQANHKPHSQCHRRTKAPVATTLCCPPEIDGIL
jgi:hypothetical protein